MHLPAFSQDTCSIVAIMDNPDSSYKLGVHPISLKYFGKIEDEGDNLTVSVQYDGKQIYASKGVRINGESPVVGKAGGAYFLYLFPSYVIGPYYQNFNTGILILFHGKNYKIFYNLNHYYSYEICDIDFSKVYCSWFKKYK